MARREEGEGEGEREGLVDMVGSAPLSSFVGGGRVIGYKNSFFFSPVPCGGVGRVSN